MSASLNSGLNPGCQHGFTMVELVVAISISSIVVAFAVMFLTAPMDTYLAQNRRSELNYSAESMLHMLGDDVRNALPNSLRVQRTGNLVVIEMLNAVDSARYRLTGSAGDATRELDFTAVDTAFDTVGHFRKLQLPFDRNDRYLVVNHLGLVGTDAYAMDNVITTLGRIQITSNPVTEEDHVTLTPGFRFGGDSPGHRAFLVSGPVAYLCNEDAGTLERFSGYAITANLNNLNSAAGLIAAGATSRSTVANNIESCEFTTSIRLPQQNDLLGVMIVFLSNNERLRVFEQFAVDALP